MLISLLEQGFIYGILSLGVYISYKILDFPDLTVDGSIVLGEAIAAILIIHHVDPVLATLIALLGGAVAGLLTGILHVYLKIKNLLSGILMMIALYSINLHIMTKPNLSLFKKTTLFTYFSQFEYAKVLILFLIAVVVVVLLDLFFKTNLGTLLRMTGDNPILVTSLGGDIGKMKILGLMVSNALVAFSGALLAQYLRFADITSGTGTIVVGLAAVIIGESLLILGKKIYLNMTIMVVLGAVIYKAVQAYTLKLGSMNDYLSQYIATDFKLITALMIIVILGLNNSEFLKKIYFRKGVKRC